MRQYLRRCTISGEQQRAKTIRESLMNNLYNIVPQIYRSENNVDEKRWKYR